MDEMVIIGQIGSPVGIKGEVRVLPLTDFPQRFEAMDRVLAVQGEYKRLLHLEAVQRRKQNLVIKFQELNSIDDAHKLKGAYLKVLQAELVPLPEGEYYIFQLVGLPVYQEKEYLGDVQEVLATGSNDVYLVRNTASGEEILVPALKNVVLQIDLQQRFIKVKLPPGLRD